MESPEAGSGGRRVQTGGRTRALLSDGAQTVPESHFRIPGVPLGHFFSDFHILLLQVSSVDEFCKSYLGRSTQSWNFRYIPSSIF